MRDFQDIPTDTLRAITAPTLVLNGDADVVKPEHAVALMRLLPHAQVAILPGTDHMAMMTRTDLLVPMINGFLDSVPVK
jgi:pimeloyl-ACP methyl ester carboxylesterase